MRLLDMPRFYLRLALIPLVLFTAAALLIHSQPYTDRGLKAFVMPDNCVAQCLMGIQPGITTMQDAIQRLWQNPWIDRVTPLPNGEHPTQIWWVWKDSAPDYLRKGHPYSDGQILISFSGKVGSVNFGTTLVAGDDVLMLGKPDEDGILFSPPLLNTPDPNIPLMFELWYMKRHLAVSSTKPCPYYTDIWHMPVNVGVMEFDLHSGLRTVPIMAVPDGKRRPALRKLSQQVCGF